MAKYNWFKWRHFKRVHGVAKLVLGDGFKINIHLCSSIPSNPRIGDTFLKDEDGCVYTVVPAVERDKFAALKLGTLYEFNEKMGIK